MPYRSKSQLAGDPTDFLAVSGLYIEVYHINSGKTVRFKSFMKDYNDVHNVTYDDQNFIGQSGFTYAKAFECPTNSTIEVSAKRNENNFNVETKVIIIGTTTNARAEVPVTIKPNTVITT